jgi:hypothetical protein
MVDSDLASSWGLADMISYHSLGDEWAHGLLIAGTQKADIVTDRNAYVQQVSLRIGCESPSFQAPAGIDDLGEGKTRSSKSEERPSDMRATQKT